MKCRGRGNKVTAYHLPSGKLTKLDSLIGIVFSSEGDLRLPGEKVQDVNPLDGQ